MKLNGLFCRIIAVMIALVTLFTVAGCRTQKYRVEYVTSEYEKEIEESLGWDSSAGQIEDTSSEEKSSAQIVPSIPSISSQNSSVTENTGTSEDNSSNNSTSSGISGNDFLSGGIVSGGKKVTVENVDNALYGTKPTIKWSELDKGQTVGVLIKDASGKTIVNKKGLKGTSYKCEKALINGAKYTLKVTYTNADGTVNTVNTLGEKGKEVICLAKTSAGKTGGKEYGFKNSISLDVLNNYLDRATYYGFMSSSLDPVEFDEGARYLLNIGAKYVLRAGGEWYASNGPTTFAEEAKEKLALVHSVDPDIIFEACIFETVTSSIDKIKIPAWVFEDFGLKPEDRNFKMTETIFKNGYGINQMGLNAHIPDITRIEHQMFVYYRATQYIDMGFEALHLGQVNLIGQNDPNDEAWTKVIGMIRKYAKKHARRGYVIINAHGELINSENGAQLVDMIVAPTRILAASDEKDHEVSDNNPQRCDIFPGHADSVYKKRIERTSPSGWTTDKYPYLVHLDNYDDGVNGDHSKMENIWGWDETSWYLNQPQWYRVTFMKELYDKIKGYNENGHFALVMKGSGGKNLKGEVYAVNNKSEYCPEGSGDEEFIKIIFSGNEKKLEKTFKATFNREFKRFLS